MVLLVLGIMLSAGLLTFLIYFFLYITGILRYLLMTPFLPSIVMLLVSSIIGSIIAAVAGEKFLNPLNQLIEAAKVVSTGDLSVRLTERDSPSEVGDLLKAFNRMIEELGSIEIFRRDFINNFSHEIKSPIVSISGFAKQLRDDGLPPEKRREYIEIIIKESERLSRMSSNILLLTNYENQQKIIERSLFDLDEQLRSCLILLEKKWAAKNLDLNIELPRLSINADPEMLSHLWLNLLDNAIKYSDEGGRLRVTTKQGVSGIEVVIADSGKGMNENELKHVFEKFYQCDRSRAGEGNGLGLSIAKRVAELHGGRIEVESRIGEGAVFRVFIPMI